MKHKVNLVLKEKKIRNAYWALTYLENGKYRISMNAKTQRIFTKADDARFWFNVWTTK